MKEEVYKYALSRRTIHHFTDEPVGDELLILGLEAALRAPNHKMTFPWGFVEVGTSLRAELAEIAITAKSQARGRALSDAQQTQMREKFIHVPRLLVATQIRQMDANRELEDYASCACGIQNLALVLWENGVGLKWGTGAVIREFDTYRLLGINPTRVKIIGLLWIGYPSKITDTARPLLVDCYRLANGTDTE